MSCKLETGETLTFGGMYENGVGNFAPSHWCCDDLAGGSGYPDQYRHRHRRGHTPQVWLESHDERMVKFVLNPASVT